MRAFYLPWRTHPTQHWDTADTEFLKIKSRHNHEWFDYVDVASHLVEYEVCIFARAHSPNGRLNTTIVRRAATVRTEWSRK